jgi:hypothetical protein
MGDQRTPSIYSQLRRSESLSHAFGNAVKRGGRDGDPQGFELRSGKKRSERREEDEDGERALRLLYRTMRNLDHRAPRHPKLNEEEQSEYCRRSNRGVLQKIEEDRTDAHFLIVQPRRHKRDITMVLSIRITGMPMEK